MKQRIFCYYDFDNTKVAEFLHGKFNGRKLIGHLLDHFDSLNLSGQISVLNVGSNFDEQMRKFCIREQVNYSERNFSSELFERFLSEKETDYALFFNLHCIIFDPGEVSNLKAVSFTDKFDMISSFIVGNQTKENFVDIIKKDHFLSFENPLEFGFSLVSNLSKLRRSCSVDRYYEKNQNNFCKVVDNPTFTWDTLNSHLVDDFEFGSFFKKNHSAKSLYSLEKLYPWGQKSKPLMIAEIGGNHEGDFEVAKNMAKLAIESGIDCVKFQLYRGNSLVSGSESPTRNKHFRRFELTKEQHLYLARMCQEAGLQYLASVWDLEMLDWIDNYLSFYKIGSGDFTAWPILYEFIKRGKPILISTGLSDLDEVTQTVKWIRKNSSLYFDPNMLCLMQCTAMYPIEKYDANLNVMEVFKKMFNVRIGYSDHTIGTEALKIATAKGANVLEFHFTDTRDGKEFRDHKVSLIKDEVKALKKEIEQIAEINGSSEKVPQKSEVESGHVKSFRRGVYLKKHLKKGDRIKEEDLVCLRPAHGIDAREFSYLIDAEALEDLKPFSAIEYKQISTKKRIF